jgi:hypothetical protein
MVRTGTGWLCPYTNLLRIAKPGNHEQRFTSPEDGYRTGLRNGSPHISDRMELAIYNRILNTARHIGYSEWIDLIKLRSRNN